MGKYKFRYEVAEAILAKGGTDEEIQRRIMKEFPNSRENSTRANWYRRSWIKHGHCRGDNRKSAIAKSRPHTAYRTLMEDLKGIDERTVDRTTKDALVSTRLGQGEFRKRVLRLWENRCSVTGARTLDALRASHIKPWRDSTDEERLDKYNGLPLTASLDALFDSGWISFNSSGKLIVSPSMPTKERQVFSLKGLSLAKKPGKKTEEYLNYHRVYVFRDSR